MYDKKGRKSYKKNFIQRRKYEQKIEKKRIADILEKKRWIAERRASLKVHKGGMFQARRPTKNAPTQAEQDREIKNGLKLSNGEASIIWNDHVRGLGINN